MDEIMAASTTRMDLPLLFSCLAAEVNGPDERSPQLTVSLGGYQPVSAFGRDGTTRAEGLEQGGQLALGARVGRSLRLQCRLAQAFSRQ